MLRRISRNQAIALTLAGAIAMTIPLLRNCSQTPAATTGVPTPRSTGFSATPYGSPSPSAAPAAQQGR